MEIGRWLCFLFINCFFIQYLGAKTVSLNELIAAETNGKPPVENRPTAFRDREKDLEEDSSNEILTAESTLRVPKLLPILRLPGLLRHSPLLKHLETKAKIRRLRLAKLSNIEKLSPLKIKKAFEIKSPLKPKKLQLTRRQRLKRKNQSKKREISGNDSLKPRNIPVLRSLSTLFDDLLNSDTSDSHEIKFKNYKRNRFYSEELFEPPNDATTKINSRFAKFRSHKKTAGISSTIATEVSSDTKNITSRKDNDHSSIRPHKNIPILLPRNTTSSRRDYNGTSKRSGTTFNGDFEGNITRDHGDHEHDTRYGENDSYEESNENDTYSATRNDSSGVGHSSGVRHSRRNRFNDRKSKDGEIFNGSKSKNENTNDNYRENQLKTRGNETKSEISVRKSVRGLRGSLPEDKISDAVTPKPIQCKEIHEESIFNATDVSTGYQRITDQGRPHTTEDEKIRKRNETMILIERNAQANTTHSQGTGKKAPVVMIFDGYSVTRDKNGENKVSGKTIHFHS